MGDAGPEVLEVQGMLADLGYVIAQADGNFDTSTLRAVIGFQSDRALPVDGVVAVNTWTALKKHARSHLEHQEELKEEGGGTPGCERERPPRTEPPARLLSLEAPTPYMPPMSAQERQPMMQEPPDPPDPPQVFAVQTVPLITWKPIREEPMPRMDSPLPEPGMPVEVSDAQSRGWTPVEVS